VSAVVLDPQVKRRRLVVRAGLCVVYVALIALAFWCGKGHTIIVDNKDAEDGSVKAIDSLTVSVDGQEGLDLSAGDRDMAKVRGQGHRVEVTLKDGQKVTQRIQVPVGEDVVLLNIPRLLAGQRPAVVPFVSQQAAPPAADQGNNNSFVSPSDPNAPPQPGTATPTAP
jgi:hypothetical protein